MFAAHGKCKVKLIGVAGNTWLACFRRQELKVGVRVLVLITIVRRKLALPRLFLCVLLETPIFFPRLSKHANHFV